MSLSLRLAEWLAALECSAVPPASRDLATLRVLDTVGLLLGASDAPVAAMLRERVATSGGPGRSTVVGQTTTTSAGWAALANGAIAHSLDFDDTLPDSVVHPGSVVVPVALAVGEEVGATGREILTAIAGAYEITARLAQLGGTKFHARGFHASGIFAPLAAAYTAARLLRLPPATMAAAAGLAASMSGGLLAFIEDGSWSKWLHLGWGGFGGILAAQLAAGGFRGPHGALDGRHNLFAAFVGEANVAAGDALAELGGRWIGDTARFKYYPCAHVIQPYIDLALDVRQTHAIEPSTVMVVRCTVAPWAVPIVCEPAEAKVQPKSVVDAIASLRFNIAAALMDGALGLEILDEKTWRRADLIALSQRVTYIIDPALTGFAARIEIELDNGSRITREAAGAAPPDPERLRRKFRALAARVLPDERVTELERAVAGLNDAMDPTNIGASLRSLRPAAP